MIGTVDRRMEDWRCVPVVAVAVLVLVHAVAWADDSQNKDKKQTTQCWECMNYDQHGKFYDQCPMNGTVDPVRVYKGDCTGKCFIHTDDLNKALIIRGCTASQWGLPNPLPEDGCYPWYSEVWCVCSTDGCNGVPLGKPLTDKEFDAHIDYSKPVNSTGTTLPGFHFSTSTSTILLSAAAVVAVVIAGAAICRFAAK